MERFKRQVVLLSLLEAMKAHGSWCGETHVQKCAYFLESGFRVPLDLGFVLYKHGPFSFDLRDILGEMRGNFLIDVASHPPYGPSLVVSDAGRALKERFPITVQCYEPQISLVASKLSSRRVAELERLGTALYVTTSDSTLSRQDRPRRMRELKPHINPEQAEVALQEVDALLQEAGHLAKDG